jgi:hypothetical protein
MSVVGVKTKEAKEAKASAKAAREYTLGIMRLLSSIAVNYCNIVNVGGKTGYLRFYLRSGGGILIQYENQEFCKLYAELSESLVKGNILYDWLTITAAGDGLIIPVKDADAIRMSKVSSIASSTASYDSVVVTLIDGTAYSFKRFKNDSDQTASSTSSALRSPSEETIDIPNELIDKDSMIRIRKNYSGLMIGGEGPTILDINSQLLSVWQKHAKDSVGEAKYSAVVYEFPEYNMVTVKSVSADGMLTISQMFRTLTVG